MYWVAMSIDFRQQSTCMLIYKEVWFALAVTTEYLDQDTFTHFLVVAPDGTPYFQIPSGLCARVALFI